MGCVTKLALYTILCTVQYSDRGTRADFDIFDKQNIQFDQPRSFHEFQERCQAIHARSWGITLACCSTKAPLPEHCKYNTPHMCKFPQCSCTIIVDVDNVQCSDVAPQREWRDHETSPDDEPFQCRNPNFPNENSEFALTLQIKKKNLTKPFLLGLSKYKIVELTLVVHYFSGDTLVQDDLFDYFRLLRSVRIFRGSNDTSNSITYSKQNFLPTSFGGTNRLEMLSLLNLSSLKQLLEKVDFTSTLKYMLIQNCLSLQKLPDWFADLDSLNYLKIMRTSLQNISSLSTLTSLRFLYLPSNRVTDISSIVFESVNLQELDLSGNEICCIGGQTFSKLVALRYLDVSDNPMKRLPSGGFAKLQNLQWLYLRHKVATTSAKKKVAQASLESLTADVLIGLKRLEYLSLENNPGIIVHHQAFASLSSLKSLDLSYCNLSLLPEAVVHLCHLRFLWLKFNRLSYSTSIAASTLAMLPLTELSIFDLSENSFAQNPHALFLIPLENTALMESIVSSLKHQPLWWHDACARRHWTTRLVNTNQNKTLKAFYANLLSDDKPSSSSNSLDNVQCDASYKKIVRELEPYQTLKDSTTCSRLQEQRKINRRFRQQLSILQQSDKNRGLNSTSNACRPLFVSGVTDETVVDPGEKTSQNSRFKENDSLHRTTFLEQNEEEEDGVEKAFKAAKQEKDLDVERRGGTRFLPEGDSFDNLPPPEDCSHLYATIDVFGYVLAANFVVLICVSLSCIILLCKKRRRHVEIRDDERLAANRLQS